MIVLQQEHCLFLYFLQLVPVKRFNYSRINNFKFGWLFQLFFNDNTNMVKQVFVQRVELNAPLPDIVSNKINLFFAKAIHQAILVFILSKETRVSINSDSSFTFSFAVALPEGLRL